MGERAGSDRVLSRPAIEAAAVARADRDGVASMTLRRLADDLAVTPMALYRHVDAKDDLVEAVADAHLAQLGLPSTRLGWRRFLFELEQGLRGLFRTEPELLTLFTRRPVVSPAARARFEAAVDLLVRAGFETERAVQAYAAVHTYTIGFCALEAGRRASPPSMPTGQDPVADSITAFVSDEQFDTGLTAMLAGLQPPRRHPRRSSR